MDVIADAAHQLARSYRSESKASPSQTEPMRRQHRIPQTEPPSPGISPPRHSRLRDSSGGLLKDLALMFGLLAARLDRCHVRASEALSRYAHGGARRETYHMTVLSS